MEQQNLLRKRIAVVDIGDKKQVLVDGNIYLSYKWNDKECERLSIVQLHENKIASRGEIVKAFGIHENSVKNYINNYREEGLRWF